MTRKLSTRYSIKSVPLKHVYNSKIPHIAQILWMRLQLVQRRTDFDLLKKIRLLVF